MSIDKMQSQRITNMYAEMVNRTQANADVNSTQPTPGTNAAQPTPTGEDSGASAIVALSPDAQIFSRALQAALSIPDVRLDRMAAARAHQANEPTSDDDQRLAAIMLRDVQ